MNMIEVTPEEFERARSATPFKSVAEQTAAMQDPRYKSDHAYRERVADSIAASGLHGIDL